MTAEIISAIIIDDEPGAINLLEIYLRQFSEIRVTGKETNALAGLELVKETFPELVFLDIDMPEMNGLQVADQIQSDNFYSEIIFTTAYQHYAYDALGIKPLDFLTKPFSSDDLKKVIQKYHDKIEKRKWEIKLDKFLQLQSNSPRLKLPSQFGIVFVEIKNIVRITAQANNCSILLQDGTEETINRNLHITIRMINSPIFVKVNRSTCINLNYLQRVDKKNQKGILSFNHTIEEVEISRNNLNYFEKLNLFPII